MSYLDEYPDLRPDPTKCGNKAGHHPQLADFPCVLEPEHTEPHEDKLGLQWNLDGSRIRKQGIPAKAAIEALAEATPIDSDAEINATIVFEFEGPLVATAPHPCSRCAVTIYVGDRWWESGASAICDPCQQEIAEALGTQS